MPSRRARIGKRSTHATTIGYRVFERSMIVDRQLLVFWQPTISIHQSALMKAIASVEGQEVVVVCHGGLNERRKKSGWNCPDYGRARLVVAPSAIARRAILRTESDKAVHIFFGCPPFKAFRTEFREASRLKIRIGLFSEPRDPRGFMGKVRFFQSRLAASRVIASVQFVLPTGLVAADWFRSIGFRDHSLFPFAYFVAAGPDRVVGPRRGSAQMLFVGSLIRRKGLDILLRALSQLRQHDWLLRVVGSGSEQKALSQMATQLGLGARVAFIGAVPNGEARDLIGEADVLLLPSRYDGWGAVVNEALMRGTPVICSNSCGAADLIAATGFGGVFASESESDLQRQLLEFLAKLQTFQGMRDDIATWARRLHPDLAANYLLSVLNHVYRSAPKPEAQWLRQS